MAQNKHSHSNREEWGNTRKGSDDCESKTQEDKH
jgi:hypothetical protein